MVTVVEQDYFKRFFEEDGLKPHVIKFFSDDCGLCHSLAPDYEKLSNELQDSFEFIKIDSVAHLKLSDLLSASGVPTILLFREGNFYELIYPDDGYDYSYIKESLIRNKNLKRI